MARSIFPKISPSVFTKEAKKPHQISEDESLLIEICQLDVPEAVKLSLSKSASDTDLCSKILSFPNLLTFLPHSFSILHSQLCKN